MLTGTVNRAPIVVVLCPNEWDEFHLPQMGSDWSAPYGLSTYGYDAERAPEAFDADRFIAEAVDAIRPRNVGGITSSSDYPGCLVAAFVADELGLPGPSPKSMLWCSHKYYSRLAQSIAVPEATPAFSLIDPNRLTAKSVPLAFPIFVKPVKSWFSQYARRIDTYADLSRFVGSSGVRWHLQNFVRPFEQLLARFPEFQLGAQYLIAEELLSGHQVTLEGYMFDGRATVVGVVDSGMYGASTSFERFDYPSVIERETAERMLLISERALRYVGFDNGLFNIEFFYDASVDSIQIIEINPRMCGQFADLMLGVNGVNTYEILLALAIGDAPPGPRQAAHAAGVSFALRHFSDAVVVNIPDGQRLARICQQWDVTMVANFYTVGAQLSNQGFQYDGFSYRYAVVNMLGRSRDELTRDFARVRSELGYELADVR
jgi:hypothetical protein